MSVKIRLSYSTDRELEAIRELLKPLGLRVKEAPQLGYFKRAYLYTPRGSFEECVPPEEAADTEE